ncbi:copper transporter 4-like [Salvia miltiorrhiza]|uniref:copper transporter 4-like n=1 Tax=Salvia miltiorrhiza TaxID=226208 RepID=UPI0025AB9103|nr:copper transporter 4-like [Salvia miltiorrhiza]
MNSLFNSTTSHYLFKSKSSPIQITKIKTNSSNLILQLFTTPCPPRPRRLCRQAAHIHHHHPFHVAFYWCKEAQFLFPGWPDNKPGMYAVSLVFVFALAIFAEFLSNLNLVKPGSNRAAMVFFQTGFHAVRAGFSYLVMLAVMSYNGGVFIAAVLGHAIGYVMFGSGLRKGTKPN